MAAKLHSCSQQGMANAVLFLLQPCLLIHACPCISGDPALTSPTQPSVSSSAGTHAVIVLRQQADLLLGRMHMADGLEWKALDPIPALGPVLAARQQAVHLQRLCTGQICVSVQSDDALRYTFIDTKITAVRLC